MKTIYLTHLYPKEMAIYGDIGNIITLRYNLLKLGLNVKVNNIGIGEQLPKKTDFYFIGGGADKDQLAVANDLQNKKQKLKRDIERGVPMLAICGGYQLLGEYFQTGDGDRIKGLDILPIYTIAQTSNVKKRAVGNIVIKSLVSEVTGEIVGFENHSGQTFSKNYDFQALGKVLVGKGNNNHDKLEGCIYKNIIGCYLHGPCLAKNPNLTNYFLKTILHNTKNTNLLNKIKITPNTIFEALHTHLIKRFG